MAKITTAQAYKNQVKVDRRAAAAERRAPGVAAYDARVKEMYRGGTEQQHQKKAPETQVVDGRTYKVTRLAGGLKASLAAEKAARTMRARRLAAKKVDAQKAVY